VKEKSCEIRAFANHYMISESCEFDLINDFQNSYNLNVNSFMMVRDMDKRISRSDSAFLKCVLSVSQRVC